MMNNKFIDFIITQNCTYNCEYCSQSKRFIKDKKDASDCVINSFILFLDKIDPDFIITITGGEALLHKRFFELIEKIKNKGFKINLISNFSFDIEFYKKILKLSDNSLNRFDFSFHLDEIKDFLGLIKKLDEFMKYKNFQCVFLIPVYKINQDKEEKIEKIKEIADKYNIPVEFQHIRVLNKKIKYSKKEEKYFKDEKSEKSYSKLCHAGSLSAVIYEDGSVYRCYSSRFLKSNYLGNIKDKKFSLNSSPAPCPMTYCNCLKPKIYNQILNKKAPFKSFIMRIKNCFYMPFLVFSKREIIKTKLKELFRLK